MYTREVPNFFFFGGWGGWGGTQKYELRVSFKNWRSGSKTVSGFILF